MLNLFFLKLKVVSTLEKTAFRLIAWSISYRKVEDVPEAVFVYSVRVQHLVFTRPGKRRLRKVEVDN